MSEVRPALLTFLLTDVVGSSLLWELHSELMKKTMARHYAIADEIIPRCGGQIDKKRCEGDSLFITFDSPRDAARGAVELLRALRNEPWPAETPLTVRAALHTGETQFRDNDYYGRVVNRCARLRAAGHGRQILLTQATQVHIYADLPEPFRLRDLGPHRLKDILRVERVFQLCHPDFHDDFPPLNSCDPQRHNLPAQRASFVEGELKVAAVAAALQDAALLTLTGPGGAGKTRLALQVAAGQVEAFPDGVWFVTLEALERNDNARVPAAAATALGVTEEPGRLLLDTLRDQLKEKRLLLVLDNCEHVAEGSAGLANVLLDACPDIKILATSHAALGVEGEQQVTVPGLPHPISSAFSPEELAARLLDYPAPRLFVERARLAKPNFAVTPGHAPLIARICERLDGNPLLIELAAPSIKVLSLPEIDRDLRRALTRGARSAPERHQSADAILEWSERLLEPESKRLLRRLAVFAGGFTLAAARDVCFTETEETPLVAPLTQLVSNSLALAEEGEDGEYRYRLLNVIRDYCLRRLAQDGELEIFQARHGAYFLNVAERAEAELKGAEMRQWLNTLELEHENLRAALKGAVEAETRLRLASAIPRFWMIRGYYSEGREWLESSLRQASESAAPELFLKAHNAAGILAYAQRDFETACHHYRSALEKAQELKDEAGIAKLLNNLGLALTGQEKDEKARPLFEQSLKIYRALGDSGCIADVLNSMGVAANRHSRFEEGHGFFAECAALHRAGGNELSLSIALHNCGVMSFNTGKMDQAARYHMESFTIRHRLANNSGIVDSLCRLAKIAEVKGNCWEAVVFLAAAEALCVKSQGSMRHADIEDYDLITARLRAALGETEFHAAWEQGQKERLENIVNRAAIFFCLT